MTLLCVQVDSGYSTGAASLVDAESQCRDAGQPPPSLKASGGLEDGWRRAQTCSPPVCLLSQVFYPQL